MVPVDIRKTGKGITSRYDCTVRGGVIVDGFFGKVLSRDYSHIRDISIVEDTRRRRILIYSTLALLLFGGYPAYQGVQTLYQKSRFHSAWEDARRCDWRNQELIIAEKRFSQISSPSNNERMDMADLYLSRDYRYVHSISEEELSKAEKLYKAILKEDNENYHAYLGLGIIEGLRAFHFVGEERYKDKWGNDKDGYKFGWDETHRSNALTYLKKAYDLPKF